MSSDATDFNTSTAIQTSAAIQQMVFEEIMLHEPPPLRIEHVRVPIGDIEFDPENPRLKYQMELYPDKPIMDLLFEHPDTAWLMKDIQAKGVLDPIYVRKIEGRAPHVLVVEGNRRTATVRTLHEKFPDEPRFSWMPARVLPETTTRVQEALLMASFHVAGKVKWEAHEKAGHIWQMLNEMRIPQEELASTLHMAIPSIKRQAESYALLMKFKQLDGGKFATKAAGKWSFFAEMLKVKEFRDRHAKGPEFSDQFCRWVGEGRIPKAEDVRTLEAILKRTKARNLFESHMPATEAFAKAAREVDAANPARNSKFFAQLEKLIALGKQASLTDLDTARDNEAARDTVIEAHQVLDAFMERAGVRPVGPRRVA